MVREQERLRVRERLFDHTARLGGDGFSAGGDRIAHSGGPVARLSARRVMLFRPATTRAVRPPEYDVILDAMHFGE